MRWLMCLRRKQSCCHRCADASCQARILTEVFYITSEYLPVPGSVLHNCFGGSRPDAENVAMPLLAFNSGQYYTPVCLLVSMHL
jgi:hypothetical protein